jgi:hypothetical protein
MARIVVGSPNLTQPLLLYPCLGPTMLEQHRRSYFVNFMMLKKLGNSLLFCFVTILMVVEKKTDICFNCNKNDFIFC